MAMSLSLIKIAEKTDLGPVGVALIEKLSAAIGMAYKPIGTIMDAWSEVQAGKIKAVGEIEIQAAQRRAFERLLCETMTEQKHLESIYGKTYALLENDPDVDAETIGQMDNDWIVFHSIRARRVSDEDMQSVWAKIFAEEAKKPGSFSKRTVAFIESLEKAEAHLFNTLCSFVVYDDREPRPTLAIPHEQESEGDIFNSIFLRHGINSAALIRLDSIGLVKFTTPWISANFRFYESRFVKVRYFDDVRIFQLPPHEKRSDYCFVYGAVDFTELGQELFRLSAASAVPGLFDYLETAWRGLGVLRVPEGWDPDRDGILQTGEA
jgi:hypothetical protein